MEVMARRSTVLKISNLVKKYGDHTVIDHFNLQVYESDAVALTGRNGSGKSTVLRCIVGSDKPTEGTIEVLGEKAKDTEISFRRNVATVIDDLDFFPDLSVVEHLDLLARAHGLEDTDELVDSILEEVHLVPQSGQLPGTLSSGQRRRLALATAFVRPKKLLVLDEPEQRLDQEGIDWLGKRLRHEKEHNGLAIIMASHEPSLVEAVGARIVRIGGGLEETQSLAEPEQLA
ncbi:ABC transporter ATP-binding protein [Propionibacterium freudenreichii]